MSELATLARPYAEAVFKRAKETESSTEWSDNLEFLAIAMTDQELAAAADNPRIEQDRFSDLLLDICKGHISKEGENFVRLLIENGRLSLVSHIRDIYEAYRAEDEGYIEADVKSAFPLSKANQNALAKTLEKHLNREVHLHVEQDKSLIGGVLIRAGNTVIDASVSGQLQKLSKKLYS
jgi:F-type H+-transporting ATPase subunit delta